MAAFGNELVREPDSRWWESSALSAATDDGGREAAFPFTMILFDVGNPSGRAAL